MPDLLIRLSEVLPGVAMLGNDKTVAQPLAKKAMMTLAAKRWGQKRWGQVLQSSICS
jgi:hypothetical protein